MTDMPSDHSTAKIPSSSAPLYMRSVFEMNNSNIPELKTLQEGWFVEFKEYAPDSGKLARSVSSFANSHGGLLVIGAKEEQKTRRLADFSPMTQAQADACILKVRESVTAHISPPPFFEARAMEIESLPEHDDHRWIVLISIPKGRIGPYLHSSGCIYVRVGDAATPFALTDLTLQERLWSESLQRKKRMRSRIELLSAQLKYGAPSVHVVILADEEVATNTNRFSFNDFRKLALSKHAEGADAIFDHAQTLDRSFVARRTEKKVDAASVVWDYDVSSRLHFIRLPIATHIWRDGIFESQSDEKKFGLDSLSEKLRTSHVAEDVMVANLLPTLWLLSIIIHKVKMLHQNQGYSGKLWLNACAVDVNGTVPFLGTPMYFSEMEEIGLPYVLREVGFLHSLDEKSSWLSSSTTLPGAEEFSSQIDVITSFALFAQLAQSMGISEYLSMGIHDDPNIEANTAPLANLFTNLLSGGLSFKSEHNPRAARKS